MFFNIYVNCLPALNRRGLWDIIRVQRGAPPREREGEAR